jgi:uncharacterized protein (TIGR03437 family)
MRQIIRISILLAIILLSIHTTESYVRIQFGGGTPTAWNLTNPRTPIVENGRVTYTIDSAGSDNIPFSEVEQAITASFQSWEDVPTSTIAFQRKPNFTSDKSLLSGAFETFWIENSTIVGGGGDIAGALAVTFTLFALDNGEIIDASMVFNGNEFTWATDGRADAIDVQEVATHEIGHSIGLDHSPNAAATMFPRTGQGRVQNRSLSPDDHIAASVIYPTPDFVSSTGNISGRVLDNNGFPIFGAHIGVVDANGVAITGVLSQPDGTYSIPGLPPGDYTIYAQPLGSTSNPFFNRNNLGGFYRNGNISTDFQTSPNFPVNITAGSTTSFDFSVIRLNPAFESYLVLEPSGQVLRAVGSTLVQGQNDVFIGVAGPGLPQSGIPISVSGPGITINQILFGNTENGLPVVAAIVDVSPTAPIGPRNIVIDNGVERTIVTGGFEIIPAPSITSILSQADFSPRFAPESLAAAFGSNLAIATASANSMPLSLAGTSITILDSGGTQRSAPLMYASPIQINFQIPSGTQSGPASVTIINGMGGTATTTIDVQPVAPAFFTFNGNGSGPPNGFVIRFRADGTSSQEPIASFDSDVGIWVPVPINPGPPSDRVLLVLFGTGFRFRNQLSVTIGGVPCEVAYSGPQGASPPVLDQVNVFLNRSLGGAGLVNVLMTVDGRQSNTVVLNIGGTAPVTPAVTSIVKQTDFSPMVAAESLATAFGSNLATGTSSGNTNPLPTSLAGTTITLTDILGNVRQAPLMYVSPSQINFRIPPGIQPGNATITFSNSTGGTLTGTIGIFPASPGLFTLNGAGSGPPNGFAIRFRADGTSSQEPIAGFDQAQGIFVPVPINLGPPSDRVLLVLFGTGFRSVVTQPFVTIGGVDYPAVYAGPEGNSPQLRDQVNVFLDRSLSGAGLVNALMKVDGRQSNTVDIFIQ